MRRTRAERSGEAVRLAAKNRIPCEDANEEGPRWPDAGPEKNRKKSPLIVGRVIDSHRRNADERDTGPKIDMHRNRREAKREISESWAVGRYFLLVCIFAVSLGISGAASAATDPDYIAGNIALALTDLGLIESERASGEVPPDFAADREKARRTTLRDAYADADNTSQARVVRQWGQRRAAAVLSATRQSGFLQGFPDPKTVTDDTRVANKGEPELVIQARTFARFDMLTNILEHNSGTVWEQNMPPGSARLMQLYELHRDDILDRVRPTLERDGCSLWSDLWGTCRHKIFWGIVRAETFEILIAEALAEKYLPVENRAAFVDASGPAFSRSAEAVRRAALPKADPFGGNAAAFILIPIVLIIGAIIYFIPRKKQPPPPPTSTNYGSAEFKKQEPVVDPLIPMTGVFLGKQSRPGQGGARGFPLFTEPNSHTLVLAPTRTGKGTRIIVPTLLRYIGSAVVIDPKGENAAITARARTGWRNKVYILNPWGVLGSVFLKQGLTMASFNPLDVVRANDPRAVGVAHALAEAVCKRSGDPKNSYWEGNAAAILTAVILWLADEPGEKLTLARVREIITLPLSDLIKQYFLRMAASSAFEGAIRESIGPFIGMAGNDMGAILRTLNEATRFMSDPQLKNATAKSDFDIRSMANETVTLYLVIPPDMMATQATWLRLVLSAVTSTFRQSPDARATRCMMLIDELPALGHIPDLETDLATMAGYGLDYVLIVQDLGQLRKHYGKEGGNSILTNCAWKWFSNIRDYDTAKYVSDALGDMTVATSSKSESSNESGTSSSTSYGEIGRKLMTPDELMKEGRDLAIVFGPTGRPWYLEPLDYWRIEQEFAWLKDTTMSLYLREPLVWMPNPYHVGKQTAPPGL